MGEEIQHCYLIIIIILKLTDLVLDAVLILKTS